MVRWEGTKEQRLEGEVEDFSQMLFEQLGTTFTAYTMSLGKHSLLSDIDKEKRETSIFYKELKGAFEDVREAGIKMAKMAKQANSTLERYCKIRDNRIKGISEAQTPDTDSEETNENPDTLDDNSHSEANPSTVSENLNSGGSIEDSSEVSHDSPVIQ